MHFPPRGAKRLGRRLRADPERHQSTVSVLKRLLLLSLLALTCMATAPVPTIFFPRVEAPEAADVIFVLGPPTSERLELAATLFEEGYGELILISAEDGGWRFNLNRMPICHEERAYKVICAQSNPFTTQGEIGTLNQLASENQWESALVITSKTHVARARVYLDRCFKGESTVVAAGHSYSAVGYVGEYLYQLGGFVKSATLSRGC